MGDRRQTTTPPPAQPAAVRATHGHLVVDGTRCHGCQACMVACSLAHEGLVIPSRARIQVAVNPFSGTHAIRYCRQCRQAACAAACPQEAISQREDGVWVVDASLCTGCGACVIACPFGAMLLPQGCAVALKCDTCDGCPACVESCPRNALTWRLAS